MTNEQTIQIVPMKAEHARDVARLHIEGIHQGFISSLGEEFVTALYETLAESAESFSYVAVADGRVVGFASFTTNLRKVYHSVLRKRGLKFVGLLLRKVFSVLVLCRILETLLYPRRIGRLRLPDAELLSIGVAADCRGQKLGNRLIERGFQECAARGIERVKVLVADFNKPANRLYRKTGFRLATQIVNHGIVSNVYVAPVRSVVPEEHRLVFRSMRLSDVDQVVTIHRFCFPPSVSLFSVLNPHVARHLYAQYVEEQDSLAVVMYDTATGLVAGYAAGTLRPGFQKRFFKRHWFLVGWYLFWALAAHPSLFARLARTMLRRERFDEYRRHPEQFENAPPAGPVGYFMPIALHPDYRGGGNAVRLARALMDEFFKRGVVRIRGNKIDINNIASRRLFVEKLGWNSAVIENESVAVWIDRPAAEELKQQPMFPPVPLSFSLQPPPAFITYGWCRSSYAVLFSLGQKGINVHVGDASSLAMCRFSRYSRSFIRLPDFFLEPERYIDALLKALERSEAEVLLPCHEDIGLVSRFRDRFPRYIRTAVPAWQTYQVAEDKLELMRQAANFGVPVPQTCSVQSEHELEKAVRDFTWPVILKTRIGNSAKGVAVTHSWEELKQQFRYLIDTYELEEGRWPFLQEYLPGRAAGVCALYDRGKPLAFFAEEYLRCKEPNRFGTSTMRKTLEDPVLVGHAQKLLGGLGWHGLAHLDFIQDAAGTWRLIELNPRPWGAMALALYAGVDFPWLWYRLAKGEEMSFADFKPQSLFCRWILGDFFAFVELLKKGRFSEAGRVFLPYRNCRHDDFLLTDPLPFVFQHLDYFVKFLKSGGSLNPATKNMVR
ncbi:MAG TPA: GNAT family N-acetyltransferase [Anaerohalosphaeraceae bacterium]|nr:GNAT family N-acetyltransferase [Anaerohalosphaeraceae bacterium]